jgi:hypothetical protein
LCTDCHDEQEPGLRVFGCLSDLVPFELTTFDTLPVDGDAINSNGSLALGKKFRG